MDFYPHKAGPDDMDPVALIKQNVCISFGDRKHFVKVDFFEPIPPFQFLNIGAIAAGITTPSTQGLLLEMNRNEFGQFRWYVLDNAQVRLWLPNVDGRFSLSRAQSYVDLFTPVRNPSLNLTEMFVWEDNNPWFQATNPQAVALHDCRLIAMGFRFLTTPLSPAEIAKIKAPGGACTYITASGNPGHP